MEACQLGHPWHEGWSPPLWGAQRAERKDGQGSLGAPLLGQRVCFTPLRESEGRPGAEAPHRCPHRSCSACCQGILAQLSQQEASDSPGPGGAP